MTETHCFPLPPALWAWPHREKFPGSGAKVGDEPQLLGRGVLRHLRSLWYLRKGQLLKHRAPQALKELSRLLPQKPLTQRDVSLWLTLHICLDRCEANWLEWPTGHLYHMKEWSVALKQRETARGQCRGFVGSWKNPGLQRPLLQAPVKSRVTERWTRAHKAKPGLLPVRKEVSTLLWAISSNSYLL